MVSLDFYVRARQFRETRKSSFGFSVRYVEFKTKFEVKMSQGRGVSKNIVEPIYNLDDLETAIYKVNGKYSVSQDSREVERFNVWVKNEKGLSMKIVRLMRDSLDSTGQKYFVDFLSPKGW